MRKSNPMVELRVIASICNSRFPERKFKYFGAVQEEHFGTAVCRELFLRIKAVVESGREIPMLSALAEDPSLSGNCRTTLQTVNAVKFAGEAEFDTGVSTLSQYAKNRKLLELHAALTTHLKDDNAALDFAPVEKKIEETLFGLRVDENEEPVIDGTAKSDDMLKLVKEALTYSRTGRRFKTGWSVFDKLTGGLEPGNVMLLTSNTGGGKSVAAMSLLANMYRGFGHNITYISLEMDKREMMERLVANVTNTELNRIRDGLSKSEMHAVYEKFKTEFHETSDGRYSFYAPRGDYTMEQLLSQVQGKPTDVIILDYIGLAKSSGYGKNVSEEYQLRQATRFAKRFAEKTRCAVILLAQLNDEGQIMYSKGIGHHVHYWLKWMAGEEEFERGYLVMEMGKSRNSRKQDLYMAPEFQYSRMTNIDAPAGVSTGEAPAKTQQRVGERRPHPNSSPQPKTPAARIPLYDEAM